MWMILLCVISSPISHLFQCSKPIYTLKREHTLSLRSSLPHFHGVGRLFEIKVFLLFEKKKNYLYTAVFQGLKFLLSVQRLFPIQLSLGARNPEPRPSGKHSGKEQLPFNRKKPWAGPGLQGRTILLRIGWVKEEKERDRTERKRGRKQIQTK